MTCIVAIETPDGVVMGCDSHCESAGTVRHINAQKICRRMAGDVQWLIGSAGTLERHQEIATGFDPPELPADEQDDAMMAIGRKALGKVNSGGNTVQFSYGLALTSGGGNTMLVAVRGRLYGCDPDNTITRTSDGYDAIGSGEDFALGSLASTKGMDPEGRVRLALAAAAHHCASVAEPFTVVKEKRPRGGAK